MTTTETEPHQCRHRIRAITDDVGPMVAYVGWDKALNTFFLQVGVPDPDDPNEIDGERMVKSAGTKWGEIPLVEDLAAIAWRRSTETPWAELSTEMQDHLDEQQRLNPASTRRPMRGMDQL